MSIKHMPNWCVTDKQPAFYDTESATAIEQTARVYGKMEELIDSYNTLETETHEHIEEQAAVLKNEKEVVIPATVTSEIRKNVANGAFDEAIDEYAGNLEARLDNLLGSVTEGTTSMDAEVIDIRTGVDGYTYESAGKSVRAQLNTLYDCFLMEEGNNVYNPDRATEGFIMQHTGLLAENAEYTLTDFILVPYGYAIMGSCLGDSGERVGTTADATAQIIKSVCVFESDKTTVIEAQGSSTQVAWYANYTTTGDKYVRVSFKTATVPDLMLEVLPIVNGTTTGLPSDYQTGLTRLGMTAYEPYEMNVTVKGLDGLTTTWYLDKKIAVLGDSITELEQWQPYLESQLGATLVNCGVGGSRVANYPADERTDYMCGDTRINDIPTDSDVILVFGGHNDFSASCPVGEISQWWTLGDEHESEFIPAYSLMLKKLIERFPNAQIITMTCVGGRTSEAESNQDGQFYLNGKCMTDYSKMIKEVSEYYGIPCIDVGGESGINTLNHTTYIADVIHPNAAGGKKIAQCVLNGLKRFEPIDL